MTDDFRAEAEAHWSFIEKLLDSQVPIEKVHYLYVESMVHGFKHRNEEIKK